MAVTVKRVADYNNPGILLHGGDSTFGAGTEIQYWPSVVTNGPLRVGDVISSFTRSEAYTKHGVQERASSLTK